jgi:hypothetical protein
MTKLDPTMPPESGKGSDADRLSQSPQAIRHGNQDTFDLGPGEVTKDAGNLDYDANPRQPESTDPWAPSH